MKNPIVQTATSFLVLIMLVSGTGLVSAQDWNQIPSGTGEGLSDIHFPSRTTGYIVGYEGTILKSTDGGDTWTDLSMEVPYTFNTVFFTDTLTGFVGGLYISQGVIFKTTDGGNQWTEMLKFPGSSINDMVFVDDTTGYAAGGWIENGLLLKTTDFGETWENQSIGLGPLYSISMSSPTHGIAVGSHGTIEMTINGSEWFEQWAGDHHYSEVFVVDSLTSYIVGNNSRILKSINGGYAWNPMDCGGSYWLNSVFFTRDDIGYIVGVVGLIMTTNNGGEDWTLTSYQEYEHLNKVYFLSPDTGFIVGNAGIILKTTNGGGLGTGESSNPFNAIRYSPNPASGQAVVTISLEQPDHVAMELYDLTGRQVFKNRTAMLPAGKQEIVLDVSGYPAGIYTSRIQVGNKILTGKIVVRH